MKPRLLTVALLLLCGFFFPHPKAHASRSGGHFPPPETATLARYAVTFHPRHTETHTDGPWKDAWLQYDQDDHGRLGAMTVHLKDGSSRTFTLGYDSYSRLGSSTTAGLVATYEGAAAGSARNADGQLMTLKRGPAANNPTVTTSWSYEAGTGLLTDVAEANSGGNSYNFHLTRDARRRVFSRVGDTSVSWGNLHYDGINQLQSANVGVQWAMSYGCDARGNRIAMGKTDQTTAATTGASQPADLLDEIQLRTLSSRGFGVMGWVDPHAKVRVTTSLMPWWTGLAVDAGSGAFLQWWDVPESVNGGGPVAVDARVQGVLLPPFAGKKPVVAEQTVHVVVPPMSETLVHDAAGRLVEDAFWYDDWDAAGRLRCLTRKGNTYAIAGTLGETLAFDYDAEGRRTTRTYTRVDAQGHAHVNRSFVLWADWLPVLEERTRALDDAVTELPRRWFQWGADLSGTFGGAGGIGGLVAILEEGGRTLLPIYDGLGNIVAVVNTANGETVARYQFDPFGEPLGESGEADACPFRWQTKWYDAECEHYYFGYRHYNPRLGRWLSRDPLGEEGGFNLYAYCGNDPINQHDPLGLVTEEEWDDGWNTLISVLNNVVPKPNFRRNAGKEVAKAFDRVDRATFQPASPPSSLWDYPRGVFAGIGDAIHSVFPPTDYPNSPNLASMLLSGELNGYQVDVGRNPRAAGRAGGGLVLSGATSSLMGRFPGWVEPRPYLSPAPKLQLEVPGVEQSGMFQPRWMESGAVINPFGRPLKNGRLAGQMHRTGVPFDQNGFPVFESLHDVSLPPELIGPTVSDTAQFSFGTRNLREFLSKNPALRTNFSAAQLEAINRGEPKIPNFTWHHHQNGLLLELVDELLHQKTGHSGGRQTTGGRP